MLMHNKLTSFFQLISALHISFRILIQKEEELEEQNMGTCQFKQGSE